MTLNFAANRVFGRNSSRAERVQGRTNEIPTPYMLLMDLEPWPAPSVGSLDGRERDPHGGLSQKGFGLERQLTPSSVAEKTNEKERLHPQEARGQRQ